MVPAMALSMGSNPRSARPERTACATARYDEQPTGANATPRRAAYASSTACEYEPSIPSKAAVSVRVEDGGSPDAGWALIIVLSRKEQEPLASARGSCCRSRGLATAKDYCTGAHRPRSKNTGRRNSQGSSFDGLTTTGARSQPSRARPARRPADFLGCEIVEVDDTEVAFGAADEAFNVAFVAGDDRCAQRTRGCRRHDERVDRFVHVGGTQEPARFFSDFGSGVDDDAFRASERFERAIVTRVMPRVAVALSEDDGRHADDAAVAHDVRKESAHSRVVIC